MNCAIIIERADVALGGGERSVFELRAALSVLGVSVDILAAKGQTKGRHIHVLCGEQHGKRTSLRAFEKAIRKHLRENSYDIVHSTLPFRFADVYQPRGGTFAESVRRHAASYGNRLIRFYKLMTSFTNYRRETFLAAERRLCADPDGPVIAALSEYVRMQFQKYYSVNSSRMVVIPNGVKIDRKVNHKEARKIRSQICDKLRFKEADEPVTFLFVANNFRLKGLGPLIRAMAGLAVRQCSRPPYLLVAGNGSAGPYRKLAARLNIAERILFLGHIRYVQNVLAVVDVGILPTFSDASSRFILEALAMQKPVITTAFNGATDLFTNNRHGIVVSNPRQINELAEAMYHFTDSSNIDRAAGYIAQDKLTEQISVTRHAKQLLDLYESLLSGKKQQ
ncbi:MAG: glycosyltransferase family 4 protein [Planctomycetota bacterium]